MKTLTVAVSMASRIIATKTITVVTDVKEHNKRPPEKTKISTAADKSRTMVEASSKTVMSTRKSKTTMDSCLKNRPTARLISSSRQMVTSSRHSPSNRTKAQAKKAIKIMPPRRKIRHRAVRAKLPNKLNLV